MTPSLRPGSCCGPRVLPNGAREPKYARIAPETAARRVERAFREVEGFLRSCGAPVGHSPRLELCRGVRDDRESGNKRAYFHVGHKGSWTVCHDLTAGRLSDSHLYGLVLHEFGHPLAWKLIGKSRQEDADQAIFKLTGIPILYRTGWIVQWITPGDVKHIKAIVRR